MICKKCNAEYNDDSLYFCIGCGSMLKNPSTGEIIKENIVDEPAEDAQIVPPVEDTSGDVMPVEEIAEIPDDTADEPLIPPPLQEEFSVFSSDEIEDSPIPEPTEDTTKYQKSSPESKSEHEWNSLPPPVQDIPETPTAEEKTTPVKVGAGRLTGAFFVSLAAGILLFAACVLFSFKLGFNGDNLHETISNMEPWSAVNAEYNGMSLSDNLYYEAGFDKATHGFADKTEFALYMAKSDFNDFCADKVRQYADYIIDGLGKEPTITENEIVDFFMGNHEIAKETFGYDMLTADYNSIRSSLSDKGTAEKFSVSKIGWEMKFRLENVKYILSYLTLGIITGAAVLLFIWVVFIVNHKGSHVLGFIGNTLAYSGLAAILTAIAVSAGAALTYTATGDFLCYLSSTLLLPSAIYCACIGFTLFVAGIIIKKVKKNLKIKAKIRQAVNR